MERVKNVPFGIGAFLWNPKAPCMVGEEISDDGGDDGDDEVLLEKEIARADAIEKLKRKANEIVKKRFPCEKVGKNKFVDGLSKDTWTKFMFSWQQSSACVPETDSVLARVESSEEMKACLNRSLRCRLKRCGLDSSEERWNRIVNSVCSDIIKLTIEASKRFNNKAFSSRSSCKNKLTFSIENNKVLLTCCGRILNINIEHYDKLRQLARHQIKLHRRNRSDFDETSFHRRLYVLLQRYKTFGGTGFQAALPKEVFHVLTKEFDVCCEAFASPLNCHFPHFCSAFCDTDNYFGSVGSFFDFKPRFGSYEVNPPFVSSVVVRMMNHMCELLSYAERDSLPLCFVIIVGASCDGIERLSSEIWNRTTMRVSRKDHCYIEGAQHIVSCIGSGSSSSSTRSSNKKRKKRRGDKKIKQVRTRTSTCDTMVYFWQSSKAQKMCPVTSAKLNRLRQAFSCVVSVGTTSTTVSCSTTPTTTTRTIKRRKRKKNK
jgi:phosphorylated CTD-interacting factor 1